MPVLLNADLPFASRGVHPTVPGTSIDVSPSQLASMASVNADAATMGFSGTTNAGVLEFRQSAGATLSVPSGQALTKLTVELVARVAAPVTYTTDPIWGVELFDFRTGATLGALAKQAVVPISGALQSCFAGGIDLWGLTQAKLLDVLSAGALRVRWTSPGWGTGSSGSLVIDGLRVIVESGAPPASKRQTLLTRRTATPGKVPAPSELDPGELGVNLADGRLFVGDGASPFDLTPIRKFRENAAYAATDITVYGNRLYVATANTGPGARNAGHWSEYAAALAEHSNHLGGASLNDVYDILNPWWLPRLCRGSQAALIDYNNLLAAKGITARWWIADGIDGRPNALDRVVRGATADGQVNALAGAWEAATLPAGGHDHGSVTGDTAITIAQMPAHNHDPGGGYTRLLKQDGNGTQGGGLDFTAGEPNLQTSAAIATQGSGQGHHHSIGGVGDHQHLVPLDIASIRWFYIVRIA